MRTKVKRVWLASHRGIMVFLSLVLLMPLFSMCALRGKSAEPLPVTQESQDTVQQLSILFAGDLMQHLPQVNAAKRDLTYDYTPSFRYLKPLFESVDLAIVNLECTLSEDGTYSGYPNFIAPAQLADGLKSSGVDVVMLANNHICDNNAQGIRSTIEIVKRAGLDYTGAFNDSVSYHSNNPLYLQKQGIGVAILNYTYGTNGYAASREVLVNRIDTTRILRDLSKIDKNRADYTIVFLHWGEEYSRKPNKGQKVLSNWLVAHGVDFIIGSHPHVVQPIVALRDDKGSITNLTAYSLGNLVSNQRWRYSDGGILLKVVITHHSSQGVRIDMENFPVWVYKHYENEFLNYSILPHFVADTLLNSNGAEKRKYLEFVNDTRSLLGDTLSVLNK